MPAFCALTGKTSRVFNTRSHSMRATKVRKGANLQPVKIGNKRIKLSTSAIKTMKKNKFKNYALMVS